MIQFSWVIFIIQLISSFMMVGIAWLVQVINYPMFKRIPVEVFRDYHQFHLKKAQLLIAPLMLIEIVSAAMLLIWPIIQVPYSLYAVNFILILLIWLETFIMQVPLHYRLKQGHSLENINRLIRFSWLRTLTWTLHSIVLILILY